MCCGASVRFGSIRAGSRLTSTMTAIKGFPDPQTRNFNFPELTSAYEGTADYSTLLYMRRLTTAYGATADIRQARKPRHMAGFFVCIPASASCHSPTSLILAFGNSDRDAGHKPGEFRIVDIFENLIGSESWTSSKTLSAT